MVDVSRNTVAILVILVIVVSGFGTWTMLQQATNSPRMYQPSSNGAEVGLTVQPLPKNNGYVKLEIGEANNG